MKILALIPARGGSKRLPRKNILPLVGKPLIAWTVDLALADPDICAALVSTDDDDIATVARDFGAMVPWLRPPELSSDTAGSVAVALHALDWYEDTYGPVDGLMLLQPTSPFRSRETIRQGIELFRANPDLPVVGVAPASLHPMWAMKLEDGRLTPFMSGAGLQTRSQDLPPAYMVTGSFYLLSPACLREAQSFFGAAAQPLLVSGVYESIDIDTPEDFALAQAVATLGALTPSSMVSL